MKVYFDKKVLLGFFLAFGILIVLGIYSYKNSQDYINTSQMVSHTNGVLYRIEKLHSLNLEIEAELMQHVISGDSTFPSFFLQSLDNAKNHFMVLQDLVKDNDSQESRIDSLRTLGVEKIALIQQVVQVRIASQQTAHRLVSDGKNKKLLAGIKRVIENMQAEELKLLQQRMIENQEEVAKFYDTFFTLLGATVLVILTLFITINSTLRARLQAEEALVVASAEIKDLYNHAPCGYHSLNDSGLIVEMNKTWLEWIGYRREEVINKMVFVDFLTAKGRELYNQSFTLLKSQGSINNLEFEIICKNGNILFVIINATAIRDEYGNFIKSRSTVFNITDRHLAEEKVIAVNNELEAFTYSVSHDLRAPLRSIDGYSKILHEDYGSTLDNEAARILQVIRNNARRMGQLIDDLLDFSRLGRKELEKSKVNMEALVENVKQELIANEKGREIKFIIDPLEGVSGDARMMRQVWINLISNAIKYSRNQDVAIIKIGCNNESNRIIYYIRDNGVGFDMKYAGKLFGVFQRLHKIQEFEGTGVGLALVHRIVSRHGGEVWAEAHVNQGATFFFFLPTQNLNDYGEQFSR